MNTQKLLELTELFEKVGIGGLFTKEQQLELCTLARQAVTELEASQTWQPVKWGMYDTYYDDRYVWVASEDGGLIRIQYGLGEKRRRMTVSLKNMRLCSLKPK